MRLILRSFLSIALTTMFVAVGCKKESSSSSSSSGTSAASAGKITLQLNWKPEPEFGGFYAASESGAFKKNGQDVEIVPGGVGTPTVQMVGAGKVDFALVGADEVVIARARGNPVVSLFAVYQTNPQGIMVHASRGFKQISDIFTHPGTLAIQRGLPFAGLLERKYGFGQLKIVPSPGGDVSAFLSTPDFAQQCYVTSEPLAAKQKGADVQTFLVADAGFNPYATVLVTRDDYLKAHPDTVKSMVEACRAGWQDYLKDPGPANVTMQKLNPGMDAQTFTGAAEAQRPLIENDDTKSAGLGTMTLDRWKALGQQLVELKVIEQSPAPAECFAKF